MAIGVETEGSARLNEVERALFAPTTSPALRQWWGMMLMLPSISSAW
jgi:hypothetical protein